MDFRLVYCTLISLMATSIPVSSHPSLPLQSHPSRIPQSEEMLDVVMHLVRTEFQHSHLTLVDIHTTGETNLDNTIRDQLLHQGNNPVSSLKMTELGLPSSHQIHHQLSTAIELTLYFVTSGQNLRQTLPENLRSHLNFNVVFNWDPAMTTTAGQSLLWNNPFSGLKHKVELIPVNRNMILQTVCFYCNRGQASLVRLDYMTCPRKHSEGAEKYSRDFLFQDYTRNFHGRHLRVRAGLGIPTLHRFHTYPNGTVVPLAGLQVPVLFLLADKLNFTINMTVDKAFGKREPDGTYSGLIGKVHSCETELGLAAVITMDRLPAVDYTNPNMFQAAVFSTAIPGTGSRWQAMFESLTLDAWAVLMSICTFFILPLYVAISLVHSGKKLNAPAAAYRCFDFLYRTMLEQGVEDGLLSFHLSGQILLVFWMFFSIIISNLYRSRLVSVMVSPLHETVPSNFEELAESDYEVYIQFTGGAFSNYMRNTPSTTFRKISQRMILEKSIHECIQQSLKPQTACISYRDSLNGVGNKNFTDRNGNNVYRKAPGTAFFLPVSPIVPKGAVYKGTIHRAVSQIIDTGLAIYAQEMEIKNSWAQGKQWARSGNGPEEVLDDSADEKLKLQHLKGVFLMLMASIVFACALFAIERSTLAIKTYRKKPQAIEEIWLGILKFSEKLRPVL